ncbi:MAG: S9 family peptidase, partial [Pseudomonas sp.]|nr:S9 family peptidase [Pseudomonas sp.]
VSRSEDDRLWILVGTQGDSPASAYLYDRQGRQLSTLFSFQPALANTSLAPMQPLTLRARDGLDLVCYLTRPINMTAPGALMILVHGGPWERDVFGFNTLHQWLANRGYSVLSINFRGSTGFGKAFINAGDGEWGRRMDDDLLDGIEWATRQGIADPNRIGIMGGSYGGYAVLASMTRNPDVYACGIDVMGPANLESLMATIPAYWEALRARFNQAIGDGAKEAGLALLRERSPVHQAHRLCKPLLIGHGEMDARVLRDESDQMSTVMKDNGVPFTYVIFPDEGHGFARPENAMYFNAIAEAFLARYLGGRAEPVSTDEMRNSSAQIIEKIDADVH